MLDLTRGVLFKNGSTCAFPGPFPQGAVLFCVFELVKLGSYAMAPVSIIVHIIEIVVTSLFSGRGGKGRGGEGR